MSKLLLFDFSETEDWSGWEIENDVVMGGNSSSKLVRSAAGNAIFNGKVSLENNGGFASLKYYFDSKNIAGYNKVVIKLKGDGKSYQFRLKSTLKDKASYISNFKTTGDWQTVEILLENLAPVYRGEKLNLPNFSANKIQEIRFLIGNKKAENFHLKLDKIELE